MTYVNLDDYEYMVEPVLKDTLITSQKVDLKRTKELRIRHDINAIIIMFENIIDYANNSEKIILIDGYETVILRQKEYFHSSIDFGSQFNPSLYDDLFSKIVPLFMNLENKNERFEFYKKEVIGYNYVCELSQPFLDTLYDLIEFLKNRKTGIKKDTFFIDAESRKKNVEMYFSIFTRPDFFLKKEVRFFIDKIKKIVLEKNYPIYFYILNKTKKRQETLILKINNRIYPVGNSLFKSDNSITEENFYYRSEKLKYHKFCFTPDNFVSDAKTFFEYIEKINNTQPYYLNLTSLLIDIEKECLLDKVNLGNKTYLRKRI